MILQHNKLQVSIKTLTRTGTHAHQHKAHISYTYIQTKIHTCKALYFLNWYISQLFILINTCLPPKGSAPCLNIQGGKMADVLVDCTTEEVAQKIWGISPIMVAKNIFNGMVLLLHGKVSQHWNCINLSNEVLEK